MRHDEWTVPERRAWAPPQRLLPSEWASRHRFLSAAVTAEPGPWSNERTPYLQGIMDAFSEPGIEEVIFLKPVQIGGSEALRNILGYWIDNDPGPCLIVMPDEQSAREVISERIKPLMSDSPKLEEHLTGRAWDSKATAILCDTMPIYVAWAGSPQRLASRPIRYLVCDEVDKYPHFSGKESSPISLGVERTTTYGHRRRIAKISTPTTRVGNIWLAWESCLDQRFFFLPCPHCGIHQRLIFDNVRWPKRGTTDRIEHADLIESTGAAWIECVHCQGRITDNHKPRILPKGVWANADQKISADGVVTGDRPRSKRVGFSLNSLYSPWVKIPVIVAEFLRAQNNPPLLMSWRNNKMAEPYEEQSESIKAGLITSKAAIAGPPQVVPPWSIAVIATADVQKDHLYYCIRAWGTNYRSQLVAHGIVTSFDDLFSVVFERPMAGPDDTQVTAVILGIDCKYRTQEVFNFCQRDPARIWPAAGNARPNPVPIMESAVRGYSGVIRRTVAPNYWKGVLSGLIHNEDDQLWLPHSEVGADYVQHMSSEHLVLDPRAGRYVWVPVSQSAANHYWDCEYHQTWIAQKLGVALMPETETIEQIHREEKRSHVADAKSKDYDKSSESPFSWATNYSRS